MGPLDSYLLIDCVHLHVHKGDAYKDDPDAKPLTPVQRFAQEGPCKKAGLPAPRGLLASVLAADEAEPGVFYAGNNQGVFRSKDAGFTWEELSILWPSGMQLGRANALVAVQE